MIKYSPKLTLSGRRTYWRDEGISDRAWICARYFSNVWDIDDSKPCWLVVSDKPVHGAIRLETYPWRVFLGANPLNRLSGKHPFDTYYAFEDFLYSFRSRVLYLWVEVPS